MTNQSNPYSACTSFLAGRLATTDGSTLIGRNEDSQAAWPKHFVVHPIMNILNRKSLNLRIMASHLTFLKFPLNTRQLPNGPINSAYLKKMASTNMALQ